MFSKTTKGTEDNRVRKLDYSIQMSKLFYERFHSRTERFQSLQSPHDVPGLYESFGTDDRLMLSTNTYEREIAEMSQEKLLGHKN